MAVKYGISKELNSKTDVTAEGQGRFAHVEINSETSHPEILWAGGDAKITGNFNVASITMSNPSGAETCGTVTVSGGSGEAVVNTHAVTANSKIILTPQSEPDGFWWRSDINAGNSFKVHYASTSGGAMDFDWVIIN
jgi:hypothetical protein